MTSVKEEKLIHLHSGIFSYKLIQQVLQKAKAKSLERTHNTTESSFESNISPNTSFEKEIIYRKIQKKWIEKLANQGGVPTPHFQSSVPCVNDPRLTDSLPPLSRSILLNDKPLNYLPTFDYYSSSTVDKFQETFVLKVHNNIPQQLNQQTVENPGEDSIDFPLSLKKKRKLATSAVEGNDTDQQIEFKMDIVHGSLLQIDTEKIKFPNHPNSDQFIYARVIQIKKKKQMTLDSTNRLLIRIRIPVFDGEEVTIPWPCEGVKAAAPLLKSSSEPDQIIHLEDINIEEEDDDESFGKNATTTMSNTSLVVNDPEFDEAAKELENLASFLNDFDDDIGDDNDEDNENNKKEEEEEEDEKGSEERNDPMDESPEKISDQISSKSSNTNDNNNNNQENLRLNFTRNNSLTAIPGIDKETNEEEVCVLITGENISKANLDEVEEYIEQLKNSKIKWKIAPINERVLVNGVVVAAEEHSNQTNESYSHEIHPKDDPSYPTPEPEVILIGTLSHLHRASELWSISVKNIYVRDFKYGKDMIFPKTNLTVDASDLICNS